jgi:glutaredoxin 3
MPIITMYTSRACGYCSRAEQLLRRKGVDTLNKIHVDTEPGQLDKLMAKTGRRTVPQIFIGELHVGGFDDLSAWDRSGRLGELLAGRCPV